MFIENDEADIHNRNFVLISDLLRKMDDLREATLNVTEVSINVNYRAFSL